ncbi:MAG: hypothetical protein IKF52_01260 [Clostridia bacterium]|nr:hypothetical protein [Clostridia bacterium]MBR3152229.1 hypothetical protein [Clostridia bacterium]MBR3152234.1 hypothetical protein [Clostridia bacterium]
MKPKNNKPKIFSETLHKKKETLTNSLFEVECFLDKTTNLSDLFKIFKIMKKNKKN